MTTTAIPDEYASLPGDDEVAALLAEDTETGLPDEPPPSWWQPRQLFEPIAAHTMLSAARYLDGKPRPDPARALAIALTANRLRYDYVRILWTATVEED